MTEGERVKEVRTALGLSLEKFGEPLGVQRAAISKIENGSNKLSEQMAKAICREYNVEPLFLFEGEGEMFVQTQDALLARLDQILAGENENIARVLRNVAYLSLEDLQNLNDLIDKLLEEENG